MVSELPDDVFADAPELYRERLRRSNVSMLGTLMLEHPERAFNPKKPGPPVVIYEPVVIEPVDVSPLLVAPSEVPAVPETPPPQPNNQSVPDEVIEREPTPTLAMIMRAVAKHYGVTLLDMRSHARAADFVRPRQVAMYLARKMTLFSHPQIGRFLGNRDHTTIMHGSARIAACMLDDGQLFEDVTYLRAKLEEQAKEASKQMVAA